MCTESPKQSCVEIVFVIAIINIKHSDAVACFRCAVESVAGVDRDATREICGVDC